MMNLRALSSKSMKVLLALLIATPELSFAEDVAAATEFQVVARSGLNVRTKPGARRIGVIPNGSRVLSAGPSSGGWMPVLYENESSEWITGYVSEEYVQKKASPSGTDSVASLSQNSSDLATQPESTVLNLTVNVQSRARLRMTPSLNAEIVDRLTDNTQLEVLGQPKGEWIPVKVKDTGKQGWVHATLLESDSSVYGERNPLEVAKGHPERADTAGAKILASHFSKETEGGIVEFCTGCSERAAGSSLNFLPVSQDSTGYLNPLSGSRYQVSSPFGGRAAPLRGASSNHKGIDLATYGRKPPVYAAKAGKVIAAGTANGYGKVVYIRHADGTETRYAHLSKIYVRKGQNVAAGANIGKVGSTGVSSGKHLHFEIRNANGTPVNPQRYINF